MQCLFTPCKTATFINVFAHLASSDSEYNSNDTFSCQLGATANVRRAFIGNRKTGVQWKRYKDQLKANLKKCRMDLQWETTAHQQFRRL